VELHISDQPWTTGVVENSKGRAAREGMILSCTDNAFIRNQWYPGQCAEIENIDFSSNGTLSIELDKLGPEVSSESLANILDKVGERYQDLKSFREARAQLDSITQRALSVLKPEQRFKDSSTSRDGKLTITVLGVFVVLEHCFVAIKLSNTTGINLSKNAIKFTLSRSGGVLFPYKSYDGRHQFGSLEFQDLENGSSIYFGIFLKGKYECKHDSSSRKAFTVMHDITFSDEQSAIHHRIISSSIFEVRSIPKDFKFEYSVSRSLDDAIRMRDEAIRMRDPVYKEFIERRQTCYRNCQKSYTLCMIFNTHLHPYFCVTRSDACNSSCDKN
jgi:hypothetical protein